MNPRHFLSILDISRLELQSILDRAHVIANSTGRETSTLSRKIMASLFFEASTRTRLSFETAMIKTGGAITGFQSIESSRSGSSWNEPFADMGYIVSGYTDIIVARHLKVDPILEIARRSTVPVINAGNGDGPGAEHPSQALADLYTIQQKFGSFNGLRILVLGELQQRTSRSFLFGLTHYSREVEVFCLNPEYFSLDLEDRSELAKRGLQIHEVLSIDDVLSSIDVIYHAGTTKAHSGAIHNELSLSPHRLRSTKEDMIVLHPLPHDGELTDDLLQHKKSRVYELARNGLPVRMALLEFMLMGTKVSV